MLNLFELPSSDQHKIEEDHDCQASNVDPSHSVLRLGISHIASVCKEEVSIELDKELVRDLFVVDFW